ncbi:MAG: FAD-dependent oxidoreductase, partial [Acidimicrobiia bacterium]
MTEPPQRDDDAARPSNLIRWLLGGSAVALVGVAVWLTTRGEPVPATTTTTSSSTTVTATPTTALSITTSTFVSTTTLATTTGSPAPTPTVASYDVVVVGDGLGGASAAIAAGRLGANVALLSPIGYLGGQAGAAGVSTMDEGSNHFV